MKKKIISTVAIAALVASSVNLTYSKPVSAEDKLGEIREKISDLQRQEKYTKQKTGQVSKKKEATDSKIEENETEQKVINSQIQVIDGKVEETSTKVSGKEHEIKMTGEAIERKKVEIKETQIRIEERNEMLRDRFRNLQKNGGNISYLEVVMGAKNFGDLLNRANAVNKIMGQDKNIMEQHAEDKRILEDAKKELETQKLNLETQKQELVTLQDTLEEQRQEKNRLMSHLKQEEHELHEYKLELQEEQAILSTQQATIQKLIDKAKKQAKQEEERIRQEAERLRQEALKKQQEGQQVESPPEQPQPQPQQYIGGFISPVPGGRVTSTYGPRWGEFHKGIDIGRSGEAAPAVVASADGIVNRSYYSASYGNVVFLTHYFNGKVYTTVYAHLQNREVVEGQEVKQGQRLGIMGTTGHSTGIHTHFEFHEGPWLPGHPNAVNPYNYIRF